MRTPKFLTTLLAVFLVFLSLVLAVAKPNPIPEATPTNSIASSLIPALESAWDSAFSSYVHTKTAAPEFTSAMSALDEYQETGKYVSEEMIAMTGDVTGAAWYKAMPTDLKKYLEKTEKEEEDILASVLKEVTGGAVRSANVGVCVGGMAAMLVAVL